ncbi:hypothetical protein DID73_01360 [Candidatus Marinamargulisbacteria bacterium SCGC AG-343-K17]|nr:hypothetical protein DID73_01360 [Candidatus Marinamargulisbacteria bacterium SCGC AG-343-K17]
MKVYSFSCNKPDSTKVYKKPFGFFGNVGDNCGFSKNGNKFDNTDNNCKADVLTRDGAHYIYPMVEGENKPPSSLLPDTEKGRLELKGRVPIHGGPGHMQLNPLKITSFILSTNHELGILALSNVEDSEGISDFLSVPKDSVHFHTFDPNSKTKKMVKLDHDGRLMETTGNRQTQVIMFFPGLDIRQFNISNPTDPTELFFALPNNTIPNVEDYAHTSLVNHFVETHKLQKFLCDDYDGGSNEIPNQIRGTVIENSDIPSTGTSIPEVILIFILMKMLYEGIRYGLKFIKCSPKGGGSDVHNVSDVDNVEMSEFDLNPLISDEEQGNNSV